MTIDYSTCTEEELWEYVGGHLFTNGFSAVLVGGAVVSIYSKGAYKSGDLDFVIQNLSSAGLPSVMEEIGFIQNGKHYVHPECDRYFIEFPPGPLGIGSDNNISPREVRQGDIVLRILSPTDCIKDRLASYYHFSSREDLDLAILVAKSNSFNKKEVKRWCQEEGAIEVYKEFMERIKSD